MPGPGADRHAPGQMPRKHGRSSTTEGPHVSDDKAPAAGGRAWRKPIEPWPWAKFWWKDWLADPKLNRLTLEQRGRFMDVFASTHGTDTPGVMDEEDVRTWAGYSVKEWTEVRDLFARVFSLKRRRNKWVLEAVLRDYEASVEAAKLRREVAMAGVAARKNRKDLATAGSTSGATRGSPQVELAVGPAVQPAVPQDVRRQTSDVRGEITDQPKTPELSARAQSARSRVGSAGSAGSSSSSPLPGIIARATEGNGGSQGRGA